jgi:hypothetical protein
MIIASVISTANASRRPSAPTVSACPLADSRQANDTTRMLLAVATPMIEDRPRERGTLNWAGDEQRPRRPAPTARRDDDGSDPEWSSPRQR